MNEKALKVLEYHKIIRRLADFAGSQPGKERCLALVPSDDLEEIRRMQRETTDAVSRTLRRGRVSFSGLTDIRGSLRRLEVGSALNIEELLHVCDVMETAERVKNWAKSDRPRGGESRGRNPRNSKFQGENPRDDAFRSGTSGNAEWTREHSGSSGASQTSDFSQMDAPEDSLAQMFTDLQPMTQTSREIRRCILSEDEISDDASSGLRQVRRQMKSVNERIRSSLASYLNGSSRTYLQDAVITQRGGRFCIPVKAEYRSQVPGMVHDQSSSGSTLFVEPMAVVKLNNDLRELEIREQKEIEIVLANLSGAVVEHSEALNYDVLLLTELDFIFARAQLSLSYNGSEPIFNTEGRIQIRKGRHPLLDPKKVVPVDIRLGDEFTLLVISGPNTGGKTVSLKTVGLFTLLGQAGLHIPALDRSELSVFSEVYADIGDEQSIEQSLSTFSSHMTNIVSFLKAMDEQDAQMWGSGTNDPSEDSHGKTSANKRGVVQEDAIHGRTVSFDAQSRKRSFTSADGTDRRNAFWTGSDARTAGERSLVLFDELGAGTDPTEGAALAIAILSNLHARGVRTIATTHYSELKVYALSTPGVENGCCEFDVETLRPTYRLLIGVPGKSNAFAISEKLGLPDYIIEDAKEHLSKQDEDFEDVIASLEESRATVEQEHAEIARYKQEIEELKARLSQKEDRLDESRDAILRKAREEAREILREAKEYADETIRKYNRLGSESDASRKMEQERSKLREKIASNNEKLGLSADKKPKKELSAKDLRVGDGVRVLSLNLTGTVSTLPDARGNLFVQMGILRSQVNIKDLEKLPDEPLTGFSGRSAAAGSTGRSGAGRTGSTGKSDRSGNAASSGRSGSYGAGGGYGKGTSSGFSGSKSYSIHSEINLIGKTTDEAIVELDKYLDDAVLAHLSPLRIVHGKGSGILRKAVHQYLRKQSCVASFRLGEYGEGDSGVTIVELK
ncbi:MAG: endonuclease MutS2 [Lachnospiraceae bacterium]|nr:endonuclease MutS2 [Lachnospiraceae bacterium]